MPLRDAVPGLQAAAAAGRGGVLGHEDRVVAVRRLPAVVARLGRRQPLRDDLRGVSTHRLRAAQLSRGSLAPAQVEPPPERARARAVDPVIDLGGVGHAASLGAARWPTPGMGEGSLILATRTPYLSMRIESRTPCRSACASAERGARFWATNTWRWP